MKSTNQHQKTQMLHTCKGMELINIYEIVRIEAISNYSKLYFTCGKTLVMAKVLAWFEENLNLPELLQANSLYGFIRIHRSHLINKNFLHQYIKGTGGGKVKLYNGEMIDVSKRKKTYFLKCWIEAA